eukprot:GHVU01138158.1.p1 GENE.GHVU01138158.1~~GHVU01138158.1.p1  ORF type:complete len:106 (-),score=0.14 GHVU01138158.1:36-353(-)
MKQISVLLLTPASHIVTQTFALASLPVPASLSERLCVCICVCICVYVCMREYLCVYVRVRAYLCMCVYERAYLCMRNFVFTLEVRVAMWFCNRTAQVHLKVLTLD